MVNPTFLRRLFIPSACSFVVYAKAKKDEKAQDTKGKETGPCEPKGDKKETDCEKLMKAIDLPLYSEYKGERKKEKEIVDSDSFLLSTIRCMRQELSEFMCQFDIVKQEVSQIFLTGKAHTLNAIDYLRHPDNTYPRIGAITAGALGGYLLAIRKGRFKRLIYAGTGAGIFAAIIYPDEAKEYADVALVYVKRYLLITYHLLNGVSRDLTGYELPSLPLNGHHLSISDSHHKESGDTVPEPSHLLPPVASATHLHLHPDEIKK